MKALWLIAGLFALYLYQAHVLPLPFALIATLICGINLAKSSGKKKEKKDEKDEKEE
jgi:hypothetical protein